MSTKFCSTVPESVSWLWTWFGSRMFKHLNSNFSVDNIFPFDIQSCGVALSTRVESTFGWNRHFIFLPWSIFYNCLQEAPKPKKGKHEKTFYRVGILDFSDTVRRLHSYLRRTESRHCWLVTALSRLTDRDQLLPLMSWVFLAPAFCLWEIISKKLVRRTPGRCASRDE